LDLKHFPHEHFHEDILQMDVNCRCGADCVRVITKADEVCEICHDMREDIAVSIIRLVNIFYFE
jgi:hypothetical protein